MHAIWLAFAVGILAASCSADDNGSSTSDWSCSLGQLQGTWRFTYTETNGTCGPIPDETASVELGTVDPACTGESIVSADRCRLDTTFTCPNHDGQGTSSWVMVLRQTGPGTITGTGTVQAEHPTYGICRSTYDIRMTLL